MQKAINLWSSWSIISKRGQISVRELIILIIVVNIIEITQKKSMKGPFHQVWYTDQSYNNTKI